VTTGRAVLMPATPLTRAAVRLMVLIILGTALFLVVEYPTLPWLLPVHFKLNGYPNGWQYRTMPRVLMPVFVQVALAGTLGAIGILLLSRRTGEWNEQQPDAKAAAVATEAVMLIALIWVAFQGYAACALVGMWTSERAGLGWWYSYLEFHGLFLTVAVAVRAQMRAGRPTPRPFVPEHWWFGQLYKNAEDPALFVPTRDGGRWTLNFGRPLAAALLAIILTIGIVGPTAILALLLR
jgi:uncharacterized membrane protein